MLEGAGNFCDGRGVDLVFFDLNAGVERFRGVVGKNGDHGLGNDGSGVHSGVHVVHGTATLAGSCFHRLGPGPEAGKTRQKRGVDIDDTSGEGVEEGSAQQAHEPGQADQFDTGLAERFGSLMLGLFREFRFEITAVDQAGRQPGPGGPFQDVGVRDIAEDEGDFGLQVVRGDGVEDGLHIGTGTGTENTEANHGGMLRAETRGDKRSGEEWAWEGPMGRLPPPCTMRGVGQIPPGPLLSLAPTGAGGHSALAVKLAFFVLLSAGLGLVMCSCETVDDRKAGGGAFEDSYLGKRLDSNNPSLEDNPNEKGKTAVPSYQQWRHE